MSRGECFEDNTRISTLIIINDVEFAIISVKLVLTGTINISVNIITQFDLKM